MGGSLSKNQQLLIGGAAVVAAGGLLYALTAGGAEQKQAAAIAVQTASTSDAAQAGSKKAPVKFNWGKSGEVRVMQFDAVVARTDAGIETRLGNDSYVSFKLKWTFSGSRYEFVISDVRSEGAAEETRLDSEQRFSVTANGEFSEILNIEELVRLALQSSLPPDADANSEQMNAMIQFMLPMMRGGLIKEMQMCWNLIAGLYLKHSPSSSSPDLDHYNITWDDNTAANRAEVLNSLRQGGAPPDVSLDTYIDTHRFSSSVRVSSSISPCPLVVSSEREHFMIAKTGGEKLVLPRFTLRQYVFLWNGNEDVKGEFERFGKKAAEKIDQFCAKYNIKRDDF